VQVQFLTYGDASDRKLEYELGKIHLLPVYERLRRSNNKILALLQTLFIPWIFRNELRQTNLLKTNQIWGGWVAVVTKWFLRKPLLARCGYEYYDFCRKQGCSRTYLFFAYWISKFVYKNASQIHVATHSDKELIQDEFKILPSKVEVRSNWIDTDQFKLFHPKNVKSNRVLLVGRLSFEKNIPLLFHALGNTGIGVDLVGDGSLKTELIDLAKKLNLDARFLGRFPNSKMPYIYNKYTVYVLCSNYEGNPKALLEAMACGLAVIGTNVPGIREVIINGKNGILVPVDSPALRKSIQTLLADKLFCQRLGKNARKNILKNNSIENAVTKEYSVYKKLMAD